MPTPEAQIEWIGKEQAAKRLKVSTRTVLAMAAEGKIQRRQERDAASNQMVTRLHAGDVERIAYERTHPAAVQPVQAERQQALQVQPAKQDQAAAALLLALSTLSAAPPSQPIVKLWLDLDAAAEYTGLSRALLVRLIHQGRLPAFQDEPTKAEGEKRARAGSSWRVARRDLDQVQGEISGGS
jgi:hypothetical protein